jgi:hypothetical protein
MKKAATALPIVLALTATAFARAALQPAAGAQSIPAAAPGETGTKSK